MTERDYTAAAKALRNRMYSQGLAASPDRWQDLTPEQQNRWINRAQEADTTP